MPFENIFFVPMNFITNLSYLLAGMIGIFIIIGIIIIATLFLNFATKKRPKKDK